MLSSNWAATLQTVFAGDAGTVRDAVNLVEWLFASKLHIPRQLRSFTSTFGARTLEASSEKQLLVCLQYSVDTTGLREVTESCLGRSSFPAPRNAILECLQ